MFSLGFFFINADADAQINVIIQEGNYAIHVLSRLNPLRLLQYLLHKRLNHVRLTELLQI